MPKVPTSTSEEVGTFEDDEVKILLSIKFAKRPTRPVENKHVKEEYQAAKLRESAVRAQAKATVEIATANMRKAQILHDQTTLSLFIMPNAESLSELACEYLNLRQEEEIKRMRSHIAETKVATARAKRRRRRKPTIELLKVLMQPKIGFSLPCSVTLLALHLHVDIPRRCQRSIPRPCHRRPIL